MRTQPSRRDFLKGTTAAAAGVALAGGLNVARAAHAAGGDELKIALIGCGGRGTGAADDCLASCENVKLIAVADAFEDNAKELPGEPAEEEGIAAQDRRARRPRLRRVRRLPEGDRRRRRTSCCWPRRPASARSTTPPPSRPASTSSWRSPAASTPPASAPLMETNKLADEKGLKVAVGLQRRHSKELHRRRSRRSRTARSAT